MVICHENLPADHIWILRTFLLIRCTSCCRGPSLIASCLVTAMVIYGKFGGS